VRNFRSVSSPLGFSRQPSKPAASASASTCVQPVSANTKTSAPHGWLRIWWQSSNPVQSGHVEIEENDFGTLGFEHVYRGRAVVAHGHDVAVRLEQQAEAFGAILMVIDNENASRRHKKIRAKRVRLSNNNVFPALLGPSLISDR